MATQYKRVPNRERKPVTLERLKHLLSYDPLTGIFIRIAAARPQSAHLIGEQAGYIKPGSQSDGGGYRIITVDGRAYRAHHLAWLYMTGELPVGDIDHEDTDRDNNRWRNLRPATRSQNLGNANLRETNISGIKGVSWCKPRKKWVAQIKRGNEHRYLGGFATKEEAAAAYERAAQEMFGEFARPARKAA